MVATTRPRTSGRPVSPSSPVSPSRAPRLRVVPAAAPVAGVPRAVAFVAGLFVVALLFGVAASHVVLAQNQSRLDSFDKRARDAEARYTKLRYEVAQLESPERIVAEAQQRLGMIEPAKVTYINAPPSPDGATDSASGNGAAADSVLSTGDWRRVKAELAGR